MTTEVAAGPTTGVAGTRRGAETACDDYRSCPDLRPGISGSKPSSTASSCTAIPRAAMAAPSAGSHTGVTSPPESGRPSARRPRDVVVRGHQPRNAADDGDQPVRDRDPRPVEVSVVAKRDAFSAQLREQPDCHRPRHARRADDGARTAVHGCCSFEHARVLAHEHSDVGRACTSAADWSDRAR
jgi:hypothetical protein